MEFELDAPEVRVFGALVEKSLSTPQYYPMTLNALLAACNQKSSRNPVVAYSEDEVVKALDGLRRKRLVGWARSGRTEKYHHAMSETFVIDRPARAVVTSLMLRGPQTVGELRAHTSRMYAFEELEEVERVLDGLLEHDPPLVQTLPRLSGRKEQRYVHLLAGPPDVEALSLQAATGGASKGGRLQALEEEVATLREEMADLQAQFDAFKAQFE